MTTEFLGFSNACSTTLPLTQIKTEVPLYYTDAGEIGSLAFDDDYNYTHDGNGWCKTPKVKLPLPPVITE